MDIVFVLIREVTILAMLICLGMFTKKKGMFTPDTAKRLADFLMSIVIPVLLINTLQREKIPALMPGFWATMIFSSLIFLVSVIGSAFVFRPGKAPERYKAERLAAVLPNCGFMGIPLLLAATGEESLIYCAGLLGPFNIFMWCWAVPLLDGKKPSLKKLLLNPGVLSFLAGLGMFLLGIRLPVLITSFMDYISALNTPLSMLMIGIFLADTDRRGIFSARVLHVVFWRNLAIPLLSLLIICVFGFASHFGKTFALSFEILIACSTAASALLLPVRIGQDGEYSARIIAASSLASIVTLPFVAYVTQMIL